MAVYTGSPRMLEKAPQIKVVLLSLKFPGQMQTRTGSWLPCASSHLFQLGTLSKKTVRQELKRKEIGPLFKVRKGRGLEKREVAQRF